MWIRNTLVGLALMALVAPQLASANGRLPDGTGVDGFPNSSILFPTTFGLLISNDAGATFNWVCESNIGYGGTYDPDYAIATNGDVWATTFEGLRVSRDGTCNWETIAGPLDGRFIADVEIASDGRVWATSATGGQDNNIFVSDDGATFTAGNLSDPIIWWRSIRIAPSDPDIIYVSGFKLAQPDGAGGMLPPEAHLRKSIDGGATFLPMPITDFTFGQSPNLFIDAISPDNPDLVFARVLGARAPIGDDIYRSTDGGATWTRVLEFQDIVTAFTILADGLTVVAGTRNNCIGDEETDEKGCVRISNDGGATFTAPTTEPKMGCVFERGPGELLACGANWEPDNFALARSTDGGNTWDKIVRFSEIAGPLSCGEESPQFECAAKDWPPLCIQLGICATSDAGPGADAGEGGDGNGGSCFGCSSTGSGLALLLVLPFVWRRRRR